MTELTEAGIESVIVLLTRLAAGDMGARGERSSEEGLDAVIVGINMLAEELEAHHEELEQRVALRTAELEVARAAAMESSRLKSEFLATMSHEIRTPLNGVIGLTNLLLETQLGLTQTRYAEGVRQAGEALLTIITDILDFSKLEAGMVDLELTVFDPRRLVEGVASLLALPASRKDLELIGYCLPEVPGRLVGDEGRLRQVLLNLASNAVKFTDEGEVLVTARVVGEYDGPEHLRFQVADTGIGIADAARASLFDSFTQEDASTTRRFGGTGLGLAISRKLARAMGGEIGVDSEEGVGSTFWFQVPLTIAPDAHDLGAVPDQQGLRNLRVLVVDDNATNRLVLQSQLTSWGMRADVHEYPASVVPLMREAALAGDPYAVAVLDMCMPEMDGLELAGLISADATLGETRLIMLSSAPENDQEELHRVGVDEWLPKPVRSSDFLERMIRLVATVRARPVPEDPPVAPARRVRPPTDRGRVLVVEDNELNQLVAEGMVLQLGYQVDLVSNGADALEAVSSTFYSAVLMDCQMPVMDGFTATEAIRLREVDGERLPIIAMTAGAQPEDRDRCLAVGMDGYVSKPVVLTTLEETLKAWVRQPPVATTTSPVIDPERLSALRDLGPDDGWGLLPPVANAFLEVGPAIISAMRQSLGAADQRGIAEAAHQLKGAAANIGANEVADVCDRLERAGSDPSTLEVADLDGLEVAMHRAAEVLGDVLTT